MLDKIKNRYKKFTEDNHLWSDRASALVGLGGGLIIGGTVMLIAEYMRNDPQVTGATVWTTSDDPSEIEPVEAVSVNFDDGSYITFHESHSK